tara:strand:+ start:115423 stop:116067 length:645 start_codon:yes stop_codon:yes gene_type:complete
MKISYIAAVGVLLWAFSLNAKEYNYELAEDEGPVEPAAPGLTATPIKALYISPRAWGKLDYEGRFLRGDKGADTDWAVEGPVLIKPGEQLNYDFRGEWCHGTLMAVEAEKVPKMFREWYEGDNQELKNAARITILSLMTELPIYKSDQAKYDRIRDATMKAAIGSSAATAGASGAVLFTGILIADGFRKNLCGDWHFLILKDSLDRYVVFARTR